MSIKSFRYILFLFLLLLVAGNVALAQSISGTIKDIDTKAGMAAVMVQNKTQDVATFADAEGNYNIQAKANDIVEFTYLGYYAVSITVPSSMNGRIERDVRMKKESFSLDNVVIRPDYTPYQLDSIERHRTYREAIERQKERSVMSPVSAIAENISKKSRQRWRFQKNFEKWEDQKFVDTRYTPSVVKDMTNMPDDEIYAFMAAYPMPHDYARVASELEIKMWIKYNFRQWQQTPNKQVQHPDSLDFGTPATDSSRSR